MVNKAPWLPSADSVICSRHFEDGRPTINHPLPTKDLGYNITSQLGSGVLQTNRKPTSKATASNSSHTLSDKIFISTPGASTPLPNRKQPAHNNDFLNHMFTADESDSFSDVVVKREVELLQDTIPQSQPLSSEATLPEKNERLASKKLGELQGRYMSKCMLLKSKSFRLKNFLKPLHRQLLKTDQDTNFYMGIPNLNVYNAICKYIKEIECQNTAKEKTPAFRIQLKYRTVKPKRRMELKLKMEDRILLTLMKLRLGLLHKDLSDR